MNEGVIKEHVPRYRAVHEHRRIDIQSREREFIICSKFCPQGNTKKASLDLRCSTAGEVAASGLCCFHVHCPGR